MSLHANGRTQGEITASGTKSWYDNGRLAVENGFGYLRDGSELPDIKLAADGPGKEAKDLFDQVNKLYVEIDKIPEQKAQSVAAKDELIISKQEQASAHTCSSY